MTFICIHQIIVYTDFVTAQPQPQPNSTSTQVGVDKVISISILRHFQTTYEADFRCATLF